MEIFIKSILNKTFSEDLTSEILETYSDVFQAAFTSRGYNEYKNYEFFEQIGDLSINKFVVTYASKRFPQLRSSNGVGVIAKLRILYASKDTLSALSEKLGIDKFIKCTQEEKIDKNKYQSILEDVFEAFFGALEFVLDKKFGVVGVAYIFVYRILERIFDELDIKIDYESLVDAKTRLNELKDEYKINIKYVDTKLDNGNFESKLFINNLLAGIGVSSVKKKSQITASEHGLQWMQTNMNIIKVVPERFKNFSTQIW